MLKSFFKNRHPRSVVINTGFQFSVISYVLALGLINFGVFYLVYEYVFTGFHQTGVDMSLGPQSYYFQFLSEQRTTFFKFFSIATVANLIILIVGGLVLSHRIAGPIFRLQQHAEQVVSKDVTTPISFRKLDYFPELATAYNGVVQKLKESKKPTKKKAS